MPLHHRRPGCRSGRRRVIGLAVAGLLICFIAFNTQAAGLGLLRATFINVGQGDSELLRDATGFDVLIDGGTVSAGPTVVAYLREQGLDDLDVIVASHSDADHIGGLIDVLKATDLPVEALVINGYPGSSATWQRFMEAAAARGLTPTLASFPAEYQWGDMTVHVLNPLPGLTDPDPNDASIVLRVDHGEVNFLFTGDIPSAVESEILARGTPVAAEVLKVAHHGSAYSSSAGFLAAVGAQESLIEVGRNSYGHPAPAALDRLAQAGAAIWRTDQNGHIMVVSSGTSYTIAAQTTPAPAGERVFLPAILRGEPAVSP